MSNNSIILSSSGLKNLVPTSNMLSSEFEFIFGDRKLKMNNVLAEFISPAVSRIHQSDPTISSINIKNLFPDPSKLTNQVYTNIFNEEIISLIQQLSSGNPIEISENQILNMQIVSILLGNEELFEKISLLNSTENDQNNIEFSLQQIELFYYCSRSSNNLFDYTKTIEFISSHLYSIDEERIKKLPKFILYSIISNPHLKIQSEDWLFDFIQQIFNDDESSSDNINIISFSEQIDFLALSESKFEYFIENFEFNEMTKTIWAKLIKCFYIYYYMAFGKKDQQRYTINEDDENSEKNFLTEKSEVKQNNQSHTKTLNNRGPAYDYDGEHGFNGLICHLNEENEGRISEKVNVTSSSRFFGNPLFVTELNDKLKYYMSDDRPNSWIKYEFVNFKLMPTHYSIRTWDNGRKGGHLKSWVIEGSNTDRDGDWKVLDSRNEVTMLDNNNAEATFEIKTPLEDNEFYKFVRIRQTDVNVSGKNFLILSALEFFGSVLQDS